MNSPWDPISAGSSRRSSLVAGGMSGNSNMESSTGPAISQHLGRLRKKAQNLQQEQQLQSMTPNGTPTQANCCNCGVCTCLFAEDCVMFWLL